jgi:thioesterase domain-containing protein
VHPAGGDILMYRDLSRVLGADQPFYGLQESRDDARAHALDTVDGMAAYYLDQVRAFQPEGPYMIGGYSFGGIVAYEMAKQLRAEGAEVGLLALLDTGAPGYRPPKTVVRHRVLPQVDYYRQMGILKFLRSRPASLSRAVMRVSIHAAFRWCRLTGRPFPRRLRNVGRYLFYHLARKRYLPGAYAGDLTLFRVTGSPGRPVVEGDMGWRDWVTGEVKIVNVPGHHNDMLTTAHVDALAEALGGCLQRAQGGGDAA